MADISKITLPNGSEYNIKDATARSGISGKQDAIDTLTVTLTAAGWSNKTQTVSASGVTASNHVITAYAPASKAAYVEADVYCSAQGAGTLTFTCTDVPSEAVTVNVMIID